MDFALHESVVYISSFMMVTSLNYFLSALCTIIFSILSQSFLYLMGIMLIIHTINPGKEIGGKYVVQQ